MEINQKQDAIEDKLDAVEKLLRKKKLFSYFKREVEDEIIKCILIKEKIDEKLHLLGKFAIITNDFTLDAVSIMRIYKTSGVVEH